MFESIFADYATRLTMQRLPNPGFEDWNPIIPSFNYDEANAGIDFHSAHRVVATEVGVSSRLPLGYFEVTGDSLSAADISTLARFAESQETDVSASVLADMTSGNLRIEYDSSPVKPLRMYEAVVRTGLRIHLPYMYHMRMASRSGLGFKRNIFAFPGTIDNSYRGEIMIKLFQFTDEPEPFVIEAGDRVAQGILFETPYVSIEEGEVSTETSRGTGGFGSTGA